MKTLSQGRIPGDHGGGVWSYEAINQGTPRIASDTRSKKKDMDKILPYSL